MEREGGPSRGFIRSSGPRLTTPLPFLDREVYHGQPPWRRTAVRQRDWTKPLGSLLPCSTLVDVCLGWSRDVSMTLLFPVDLMLQARAIMY